MLSRRCASDVSSWCRWFVQGISWLPFPLQPGAALFCIFFWFLLRMLAYSLPPCDDTKISTFKCSRIRNLQTSFNFCMHEIIKWYLDIIVNRRNTHANWETNSNECLCGFWDTTYARRKDPAEAALRWYTDLDFWRKPGVCPRFFIGNNGDSVSIFKPRQFTQFVFISRGQNILAPYIYFITRTMLFIYDKFHLCINFSHSHSKNQFSKTSNAFKIQRACPFDAHSFI